MVGAVLPSAPTIMPHHRLSFSFGRHWMLLSAPHRTAPRPPFRGIQPFVVRSAARSLHDAIIKKFAIVLTQRLGASLQLLPCSVGGVEARRRRETNACMVSWKGRKISRVSGDSCLQTYYPNVTQALRRQPSEAYLKAKMAQVYA